MPYEDTEPDQPRGWSPGIVALVATLILLLGLGGAVAGIYLAGSDQPSGTSTTQPADLPGVTATTAPATTGAPTVTTAPASGTPTSSTSGSSAGDAFALPSVLGRDFRKARTQLRQLKLGVNLVFEGTLEGDYTVAGTDPRVGAIVHKGITVTLYVKSSAPEAAVPNVIGLDCRQAASIITEQGLFPRYPTGRIGVVTEQDPPAPPGRIVRWNETISIWCGSSPSP